MGKLLKIFFILILILFVSIVVMGIYLSNNINQIITDAVETHVPKATGTPVSLSGVNVELLNGRVGLSDLEVGNPKGYKTSHAFKMDNLVFHIDLGSLTDDTVIIEEFTIDGANIIAEQVGTSLTTNLQVISNNTKKAASSSSQAQQSTESIEPGPQKKIIVNEFKFINNSVDLVSERWGDKEIKIPDLLINNLGKKEGGLTPDQLGQKITEIISKQASDTVKKQLRDIAKEKAKERAKEKVKERAGDKLKSLFDKFK